jgi:hypothetical protein
MALVVKDRVRETTTTTGTGTVTLGGAATGFQSFSVIGNGNTTFYTIQLDNTNEWEVGIGTYTSSGTTLSRDTILESSNSGSAVNFSAGTKDVFVTYPAEEAVYQNANNDVYAPQFAASNGFNLNNNTVESSYTFPTGYSGLSAGTMTVNSGVIVTLNDSNEWTII